MIFVNYDYLKYMDSYFYFCFSHFFCIIYTMKLVNYYYNVIVYILNITYIKLRVDTSIIF